MSVSEPRSAAWMVSSVTMGSGRLIVVEFDVGMSGVRRELDLAEFMCDLPHDAGSDSLHSV